MLHLTDVRQNIRTTDDLNIFGEINIEGQAFTSYKDNLHGNCIT